MRRTWIYGGLCVVLGALAAWPTETPTDHALRQLPAFAALQRLRPGVGGVELRRGPAGWTTADGRPVSPFAMRSVGEALAEPLALPVVADAASAAERDRYGLGEAALPVALDGLQLRVGRSLGRHRSFVQVAGEPLVRLAPVNLRRLFDREPGEWQELRLFPEPPGEAVVFRREDGGRLAWSVRRTADGWRFEAPTQGQVDAQVVERALAAVALARAEAFAPPATALRPVSVFRAEDATGSGWALALSGPGARRWARRDGGPVVALPQTTVGMFDLPAAALRQRKIWSFEPARVVAVELTVSGEAPRRIDRGGGWDATTQAWLTELAALRAAGFATDGDFVGRAELRLRTEGDHWLALTLGQDNRVRVARRPGELLVLSAAKAARMVALPSPAP